MHFSEEEFENMKIQKGYEMIHCLDKIWARRWIYQKHKLMFWLNIQLGSYCKRYATKKYVTIDNSNIELQRSSFCKTFYKH